MWFVYYFTFFFLSFFFFFLQTRIYILVNSFWICAGNNMKNKTKYHTVTTVQNPTAKKGPGGSMSYLVRLSNSSYKSITNTAWVRSRLYKLQKGALDSEPQDYQLLAHCRWFFPASSTTKTGRHDIAEILLKVALNTKWNQIKTNTKIVERWFDSNVYNNH